ncbi:MAG: DoxX family protein [Sphingomonadaceae bacterium]|nr:DoxX family protein [Sphingomonadaceae bacterium]
MAPRPSSLGPILLSVLRIVAGLLFLEHGAIKLFGFPPGSPMPMPPAMTLLWFAGLIELVGGTLIALGLFTRIAAFICSGEMAVAYFMGHFPHGFFPANNMGDAAILYCFVFLYIAAVGPGPWSLDALRSRGRPSQR